MTLNTFYIIISELVYKQMKLRGLNYKDISIILGKNESYIRKIHSRSTNKRYNLEHLSILSHEWNIPISYLIPTVESIKELQEYKHFSLKDRIEYIQKIYDGLRGE